MNTDIRTLRLVVDCLRGSPPALSSVDLTGVVDTAAQTAIESCSSAVSDIEPTTVRDSLLGVLRDDAFADRVAELATRENALVVGESNLLAEELQRLTEADDEPSLPDDGWEPLTTAFIQALKRELLQGDEGEPDLDSIATTALRTGAFDTAEAALTVRLQIARELGDDDAAAASLRQLGDAGLTHGSVDTAEEYYQQALDLSRDQGDSSGEAAALAGLGNAALHDEDLETAEQYHRESLELARSTDDRSAEANSLAGIGTVAARREQFDTAESHLQESLDLKRTVGDDSGEATSLASLGAVAENRGAFETASDRYAEALSLFSSTGQHRERLQTLHALAETEHERGNTVAAVDYCEEALQIIEDVEFADSDQRRRAFLTSRARLSGDPEEIESLYATALDRIRADDDPAAFDLLGGLWECRTVVETGSVAHGLCLRAGVGFATYHLLLETDAVESSCEAVLDGIEPHSEQLSAAATTLLTFARSGGSDSEAELSTEDVDEESIDGLERIAYAEFLDRITDNRSVSELYADALTGILRGNAELSEVLQWCLTAWQQRDEAADDQLRAVFGAGLIVEAHRDPFDVRLPTDRENVLETIRANRTELSEPLDALFERLDTGSTETTAEALRETAEEGDQSVTDVERLVVSQYLEGV